MNTYIVAIKDLFRVEAESEEEAEQKVLNLLGTDPYLAYNAEVVDVEKEGL